MATWKAAPRQGARRAATRAVRTTESDTRAVYRETGPSCGVPRRVHQRRAVRRYETLACKCVDLVDCNTAVAIELGVDPRGIVEIRGEHRKPIGALLGGLHGGKKIRFDHRERPGTIFGADAVRNKCINF